MDEFQRAGVEVIFLNRELGRSPEEELLLQVQGMVAEYERAKILERSRRGKRHAAHAGVVSVLCGAPYGYRYVSKHTGGGTARFEIVEHEARVVRQVFTWVGCERVSIGEVCRRLQRAGEPRRDGKTSWDRSVVWGMLKNPAYKGTAGFGKTRVGPLKMRLRAQRGRALQPRRPYAVMDTPREEWIGVPVPAIIFGGQRICPNTQVRTDLVEIAGWEEVCRVLAHPQRLEQEYRRRSHGSHRGSKWETPESLRAQSNRLRQGIARLIDSYAEGLIGKDEFEPRITRMK